MRDLALVCDIVRTATKNIVVLQTRQIYERIWCAGEMTSAVQNKKNIVLVQCNDFVQPDEETFLPTLHKLWTAEQKRVLLETGFVSVDMIICAYKEIFKLPVLPLNRMEPYHIQEGVIQAAFEKCKCRMRIGKSATIKTQDPIQRIKAAGVLVAGRSGEGETQSVCVILAKFMRPIVTDIRIEPVTNLKDASCHELNVRYLVAVLSKGIFMDMSFGEGLAALDTQRADAGAQYDVVTTIADTNLDFPNNEYYKKLEAEGNLVVANAFRRLTNILALPFSPAGSETIIITQVGQIAERFDFGNDGLGSGVMSRAFTIKKEVRESRANGEKPALREAAVAPEDSGKSTEEDPEDFTITQHEETRDTSASVARESSRESKDTSSLAITCHGSLTSEMAVRDTSRETPQIAPRDNTRESGSSLTTGDSLRRSIWL
jgi:hypothetical protein